MTLSFPSQFGYYGLRVNPTFEHVAGTIRKPLRIPLPDRRDKYYALSPYRALILDAEHKFNQSESASLEYRSSGAELPEHAARVHPSDAGADHSFRRMDEHHGAMEVQNAYETALHAMDEKKRYRIREKRADTLGVYSGPTKMHPVIEAHNQSPRRRACHTWLQVSGLRRLAAATLRLIRSGPQQANHKPHPSQPSSS